jgi:hypothetical protein
MPMGWVLALTLPAIVTDYAEGKEGGDPMATCQLPRIEASVEAASGAQAVTHVNAAEALHRVRELALRDSEFAAALRTSDSPQAAADLAHRHGIEVTAEALWRQRGTLAHGGLPTWRG